MPDLTPPPELSPAARTAWQTTIQRLTELNRLHTATPDLLRTHAEAIATHHRASALLAQTDILIDQGGHAVPSPALTIQKQAADTITRTTRALGLNRPATPPLPNGGDQPMGGRPPNEYGARWCVEHERYECTGNKSRGRGQCHGVAELGLNTCHSHQGRGGKQKHLAALAVRKRTGGSPIPRHPAEALIEEVAYWTGLCAWLDEVVGELEQGNAVWGIAQRTDVQGGEWPGVTTVDKAGLNTWVEWQQKAHGQKALVAKMALDAQVDAAALRFQQAQGLQAFRVAEAAFDLAGLSADQWQRVRAGMPALIRELLGASAGTLSG